jgi:hypothetical protein
VLNLTQNILILIAVMVGALLFMAVMNWIWPIKQRYAHEDLIGWQLNMLATTHAVILGFMLYTEWTNFISVGLNIETEAGALQNVYNLAEGLPPEQRARLESQAQAYATAVLEHDWPDMAAGKIPEASHWVNREMWRTLMAVRAATPEQITAEDHALSELSALTQARRTRVLQSTGKLPVIFWCVLIVGGVLTVGSVATFGSRVLRLHVFQVCSLTLLITLAILAIADLDRPFQGWVRADDYAFQRARDNMHPVHGVEGKID